MPLLTPANWEQVIQGSLDLDALTNLYLDTYITLGTDYGQKIQEGIESGELELKNLTFTQTGLFSQAWANLLRAYFLVGLMGNRIVSVNKNLISLINDIIKAGLSRGESLDNMRDELLDKFGQRNDVDQDGNPIKYGRYQMARIARTETNNITNWAAYNAMVNSPYVVNKVWITAEDERVRVDDYANTYNHRLMHEVEESLKDYFEVPGNPDVGLLLYPGEAKGAAGNVINCRCSIAPKVQRYGNGLPIRKDGANAPDTFGIPGDVPQELVDRVRGLVRDFDANRVQATGPIDFVPGPEVGFVPVRSKQELRDRATAIFESFGMSVKNVTIARNLELRNANKILEQIESLSSRYKLMANREKSRNVVIGFTGRPGAAGVVYSYMDGRVDKVYWGKGFEALTGQQQTARLIGRLPSEIAEEANRFYSLIDPKNLEISTATHEFAHFITTTYSTRLNASPQVVEFWGEMKLLRAQYLREYRSYEKNSPEFNDIWLGRYANYNLDEFFAEAWTEYHLRTNPSKYARLVGALADKYFLR